MVNKRAQRAADSKITMTRDAEVREVLKTPSTPPAVPVPSGITGTWFPALVVLPGQRLQLPGKQRVYATPEGLYIYSRVPEDQAQLAEVTPYWYAPIAYDETPAPPANYSQRAANGFVISTERGPVSITVPRGCPVCGVRAMAVWQPTWAHTQLAATWKEA